MKFKVVSLAVLTLLAGAAQAQSSVTVYGRVDLSVAQQADAVDNKEIRNGSGSRLGFRGVEELGGGLRAGAGGPVRRAVDRRHGLHGERPVRGRPAAQDR